MSFEVRLFYFCSVAAFIASNDPLVSCLQSLVTQVKLSGGHNLTDGASPVEDLEVIRRNFVAMR